MKVTTEDLGDRRVSLTIEVDPERVEQALRKAAKKLADRGKIPGYRRGKAPMQVVRRHYGEDVLYEEAVEDLADTVYSEALKEANIKPYAQGHLEEIKTRPQMILKMTVPLEPIVDLDGYRDVRLPLPEVSVSDEQVEKEIEELRRRRAIWKPAGRPAQAGDGVVVSYTGEIDGVRRIKEDSQSLELTEAGTPFQGFDKQLIGANEGETREFTLDIPEDWPRRELAGKTVAFKVTVELIRERELPELDDDFAKLVGDYDTLDQLREKVRERLIAEAKEEADSKYANDALDKIVEISHIEYPPDVVDHEMDDILESTVRQLERQGQDLDSFLALNNQTREEFRESLRPRAERNIKRGLVLGELAEKERLKLSTDEIDQRVSDLHAVYRRMGLATGSLDTPEAYRRASVNILSEKALERVAAIARGEAPELPPPEAEGAQPATETGEAAQAAEAAPASTDSVEAGGAPEGAVGEQGSV